MDNFNVYNTGFRTGLNEARYSDNIEKIDTPEADHTNYGSMGYHDGIEYGKYLVRVGMRYHIKEENIIAVIDKGYTRAIEKYNPKTKVLNK